MLTLHRDVFSLKSHNAVPRCRVTKTHFLVFLCSLQVCENETKNIYNVEMNRILWKNILERTRGQKKNR